MNGPVRKWENHVETGFAPGDCVDDDALFLYPDGVEWWTGTSQPVNGSSTFAMAKRQSYEEFLAAPLEKRLTEAQLAEAVAEVTARLAAAGGKTPAPACKCHAFFRSPDEHGQLRELRRVDRDGPMEYYTSFCRCEVCGRGWSIETMGDSHHGYDHTIRRSEG